MRKNEFRKTQVNTIIYRKYILQKNTQYKNILRINYIRTYIGFL